MYLNSLRQLFKVKSVSAYIHPVCTLTIRKMMFAFNLWYLFNCSIPHCMNVKQPLLLENHFYLLPIVTVS